MPRALMQFFLTIVAGLFAAAVWVADASEGFTTAGRLATTGAVFAVWAWFSSLIWM